MLSSWVSQQWQQQGPPPESNWILATGTWNDAGVWDDTAIWND